MGLESYLAIGVAAGLLLLAVMTAAWGRRSREDGERLRGDLMAELRSLRGETEGAVGKSVSAQSAAWEQQDKRLAELTAGLTSRQEILQRTVSERLSVVERQLEGIRTATAASLAEIRADNSEKLEAMRKTVDEKLQKTLEERIGQSFKLVGEQLEQVYKGLGEMQQLASGVGDLRRMLGGVKTRGVWGEYQLAGILEQLLLPEQYAVNVPTVPGSRDPVEFAIKLPGDGGEVVYLPIDSKFPLDAYDELAQAAEAGDAGRVDAALKAYRLRLRAFAKTIRDKYVAPPATTDFAIMFLTTEAMYAEAVKLGLVDELQRDYKVSITGPTTMGALLNSLQMGFRTLAIQKQSSEAWRVLGAAKTEFDNFYKVLESARSRLRQADDDLDKLVGTRTRAINRELRRVERLPEEDAKTLIGD
ncbi:MAG TPA: DNA recombination protein RmuC [Terriglobales bacterium]|nr:DNA recombination protein RmuC [Terriglobales bacterium]